MLFYKHFTRSIATHRSPLAYAHGKNHWLAGVIDGDGSLVISKKGYISLEITMPHYDLALLQKIKHMFGGSIKVRSGTTAVRYRLHHYDGIVQLVNTVNGYSRNSIRQAQLKTVCDKFQLPVIGPNPFSWQSSYASGLFDADGTVTLSVKKHTAISNQKFIMGKISRLQNAKILQLSISITQKYKANLAFLIQAFDVKNDVANFGSIYYDKSQNGYYTWTITSQKHISYWLHYTSLNPIYSKKNHRLRLIPKYYQLIKQGALKSSEDSYLKKQWNKFALDWFKYF